MANAIVSGPVRPFASLSAARSVHVPVEVAQRPSLAASG